MNAIDNIQIIKSAEQGYGKRKFTIRKWNGRQDANIKIELLENNLCLIFS